MPRPVQFTENFAFRLTSQDADRLRTVAGMRGMKPAEMARMIISQDIGLNFERRSVQRFIRHGEHLRALQIELSRQGNNLNQIARAMNTGGVTASVISDLATLPSIEAALRRIERAILDAIGVDDATRL